MTATRPSILLHNDGKGKHQSWEAVFVDGTSAFDLRAFGSSRHNALVRLSARAEEIVEDARRKLVMIQNVVAREMGGE